MQEPFLQRWCLYPGSCVSISIYSVIRIPGLRSLFLLTVIASSIYFRITVVWFKNPSELCTNTVWHYFIEMSFNSQVQDTTFLIRKQIFFSRRADVAGSYHKQQSLNVFFFLDFSLIKTKIILDRTYIPWVQVFPTLTSTSY